MLDSSIDIPWNLKLIVTHSYSVSRSMLTATLKTYQASDCHAHLMLFLHYSIKLSSLFITEDFKNSFLSILLYIYNRKYSSTDEKSVHRPAHQNYFDQPEILALSFPSNSAHGRQYDHQGYVSGLLKNINFIRDSKALQIHMS